MTKYLGRRREHGYYLELPIPRALRHKFLSETGKPMGKIVKSLGTPDRREAERRLWPMVAQYKAEFERAASGAPLSRGEIEDQAREIYTATLEQLATAARLRGRTQGGPREHEVEEEIAALSDAMAAYQEALESPNFSAPTMDFETGELATFNPVAAELAAVGRRTGATIEPGSETWRLLCEAILQAKVAALGGRIRYLEHEPTEEPAHFLPRLVNPVTLKPVAVERPKLSPAGGIRFSEAAGRYLDERQRDPHAKLSEQVRGQSETVYRLFQDYTKDAPLAAVTRATARGFLDMVARLDPDWGKAAKAVKRMSLDQLLAKHGNGSRQLSNKTLNRYTAALSGVFKWARGGGDPTFEGENPFREQSRRRGKNSERYLPYTTEELAKIFGTSREGAMRWIPLIALFSGMRLGEIGQLQTTDVVRKGRIWYFDIHEGEGQSLKTEAATRIVPVHSVLIRCGFLDYLKAQPRGPLFLEVTNFSKQYGEFKRSCGVDRPRVTFHSFRKNVTTCLDNAGVAQSYVAALVGHERGFTFDTYSEGLKLRTLQGIVEKIRYPGLRIK